MTVYKYLSPHEKQTTTSVAQEQLETDKDVSLQQRVPMAMATTAEGTSEMGDIEIAAGSC